MWEESEGAGFTWCADFYLIFTKAEAENRYVQEDKILALEGRLMAIDENNLDLDAKAQATELELEKLKP